MEVNRLSRETGKYVLDGVMSVIDVENWKGYEDTSYTAKVQAKYTDLVVLNKWELVSERRLEDVEDAVLALEVDPPTPRTKSDKGWVDKDIIFGLDAKLAKTVGKKAGRDHDHAHDHDHSSEVEVLSITLSSSGAKAGVDVDKLLQLLEEPTKDSVYRIKGVLYANKPPKSSDSSTPAVLDASTGRLRYILNWAFGRWNFTQVPPPSAAPTPLASGTATPVSSGQSTPLPLGEEPELRLTVVTGKYESTQWKKRIESSGLISLEGGTPGTLTVQKIA